VINSQEMYVGIWRQHAEVGHKNIITFSCKNRLDRFLIKGKQFIYKDLHHNFVQFFGIGASHNLTHNIYKI
jgi:hypothetical protein